MNKYALVTGANGGIGQEFVKILLQQGYKIFATDIKLDTLEAQKSESVFPLFMDITKDESVENARLEIEKTTNNIDVLINCAGVMTYGSLVELPTSNAEWIFATNFIGMYRVTKTMFPLILNAKGRVINVTSECAGHCAMPMNSLYIATKHACKVYNDGLRREVGHFGVSVIEFRPGAFKTFLQGNVYNQFEECANNTKYFKNDIERMRPSVSAGLGMAKDCSEMDGIITEMLTVEKPDIIYKINNNDQTAYISKLSREEQDAMFAKMFE